MLAGVDVEHEVDQRTLQARAHAPVHGEPSAGDLGGALQVQNLQLPPQVPMRLGLEIELARLAPAPDFDVIVGASAYRHRFVRNVGNTGHQVAERLVGGLGFLFERANTVRHGPDVLLQLAGVLTFFAKFRDFGAFCIALRLELLGLGERRTALRVQRPELLEIQLIAARCQALGDRVQVRPEERKIVQFMR